MALPARPGPGARRRNGAPGRAGTRPCAPTGRRRAGSLDAPAQQRLRRQLAGSAAAAAPRPYRAAFSEICWPTMERASVVKPSPRDYQADARMRADDGASSTGRPPGQVALGAQPSSRGRAGARRGWLHRSRAAPGGAAGPVLEHDALRQQLGADAVGRGKVARLLGRRALRAPAHRWRQRPGRRPCGRARRPGLQEGIGVLLQAGRARRPARAVRAPLRARACG